MKERRRDFDSFLIDPPALAISEEEEEKMKENHHQNGVAQEYYTRNKNTQVKRYSKGTPLSNRRLMKRRYERSYGVKKSAHQKKNWERTGKIIHYSDNEE